jgi:tRNA(Ile)-lysidine synthase
LIPQLVREYNPQVVDALCRLAENQRVENAWVDGEVERAASLAIRHGAIDRLTFAAMPEALRRRVFQIYAWRLGVDCGFDRIVAGVEFVAEGRAGAKFDVGSGICLINGATVTEVAARAGYDITDEIGLTIPGSTVAFNRTFVVCMRASLPEIPLADYCTPCRQVFDATSIRDLAVRRVRTGDRFRPFGMQGTRKLSEYLTGLKLTPSERAAQLVLTSAGQILWVVGRGLSAGAAVSEHTRRMLEVEVVSSNF